MTEAVVYGLNAAAAGVIAEHLRRCDARFMPALSARVDIDEYAHKIFSHAVRFEAWADGSLVGLIAAYCNDTARRVVFITSVSVLADCGGRGIGTRLMRDCLEYAKLQGARAISLEVASEQRLAIQLYQKYGFCVTQTHGALLSMHLEIEQRVT